MITAKAMRMNSSTSTLRDVPQLGTFAYAVVPHDDIDGGSDITWASGDRLFVLSVQTEFTRKYRYSDVVHLAERLR